MTVGQDLMKDSFWSSKDRESVILCRRSSSRNFWSTCSGSFFLLIRHNFISKQILLLANTVLLKTAKTWPIFASQSHNSEYLQLFRSNCSRSTPVKDKLGVSADFPETAAFFKIGGGLLLRGSGEAHDQWPVWKGCSSKLKLQTPCKAAAGWFMWGAFVWRKTLSNETWRNVYLILKLFRQVFFKVSKRGHAYFC